MARETEIAEKASEKMAEIGENVKSRVRSEVDGRFGSVRSDAADAAEKAANAADAAGAEFAPQSFQEQAATQVADRIEDVARHIRGTDLDSLVRDTSAFARKHPLMFVGGAVAVGFLASRLLKAEAPETAALDDPWSAENA